MRKPKQWGGHIELAEAANLFSIVICVVTDLSCDMFTMWIYPSITISDDVLLLGYDSMSKHYYSLKGKFIEKVSNIKLFQYFMPLAVTNSSMECGRYKD